MNQWNDADEYGLNILSQKYILWPSLTKILKPEFKQKEVLDIGCGDGSYTKYFHKNESKITGIDDAPGQINSAKEKNSGPKYESVKIQNYKPTQLFDSMFANMVICNIPTEKALILFFSNAYKISKENAKLFVTNVAPKFQKNCKTEALTQEYPREVLEGTSFKVYLGTTNKTKFGPIKNYHWTKKELIKIAKENNWKINSSTILESYSVNNKKWPEYILYEFRKE